MPHLDTGPGTAAARNHCNRNWPSHYTCHSTNCSIRSYNSVRNQPSVLVLHSSLAQNAGLQNSAFAADFQLKATCCHSGDSGSPCRAGQAVDHNSAADIIAAAAAGREFAAGEIVAGYSLAEMWVDPVGSRVVVVDPVGSQVVVVDLAGSLVVVVDLVDSLVVVVDPVGSQVFVVAVDLADSLVVVAVDLVDNLVVVVVDRVDSLVVVAVAQHSDLPVDVSGNCPHYYAVVVVDFCEDSAHDLVVAAVVGKAAQIAVVVAGGDSPQNVVAAAGGSSPQNFVVALVDCFAHCLSTVFAPVAESCLDDLIEAIALVTSVNGFVAADLGPSAVAVELNSADHSVDVAVVEYFAKVLSAVFAPGSERYLDDLIEAIALVTSVNGFVAADLCSSAVGFAMAVLVFVLLVIFVVVGDYLQEEKPPDQTGAFGVAGDFAVSGTTMCPAAAGQKAGFGAAGDSADPEAEKTAAAGHTIVFGVAGDVPETLQFPAAEKKMGSVLDQDLVANDLVSLETADAGSSAALHDSGAVVRPFEQDLAVDAADAAAAARMTEVAAEKDLVADAPEMVLAANLLYSVQSPDHYLDAAGEAQDQNYPIAKVAFERMRHLAELVKQFQFDAPHYRTVQGTYLSKTHHSKMNALRNQPASHSYQVEESQALNDSGPVLLS